MRILVLFVSILLHACSDGFFDTEYKINSSEISLGMSGFVSTDSIYIVLTKGIPRNYEISSFSSYLDNDTNAVISVFENDAFFCFLSPKVKIINPGTENEYSKIYYVSHQKVNEGSTYKVVVNHNIYKSISANIYVPYSVPIGGFDTTITHQYRAGSYDVWGNPIYDYVPTTTFIIHFSDPSSVNNYYNACIKGLDLYEGSIFEDHISDPIVEFKNDGSFFSDKYIQGKDYKLFYTNYFYKNDSLLFKLFSINEDYYKYTASIDKYENTFYDFYREPIRVFSNVEGGTGIVVGYSSSSIDLFK